jgi:phosphoenolpyruvate phosphomutase
VASFPPYRVSRLAVMQNQFSDRIRARRGPADLPLPVAGAHDALTAAIAIKTGFSAIWASSFEIATANLQTDDATLPRSSVTERVRSICRRVDAPVLIDAQTGFEDEGGLAMTVRSFQETGASGMCLEDKAHPKRNTLLGGSHALLGSDSFTAKLSTALRARTRESFLIVARTEALSSGETADSVRGRVLAYASVGCDAVVIHVRAHDLPRVAVLVASLPPAVPVGLILADSPPLTLRDVMGIDASFCVIPHVGIRAAIPAVGHAYEQALGASCGTHDFIGSSTVPSIHSFVDTQGNPEVNRQALQPLEYCPHNIRCLNFRRDGPTYCTSCSTVICEDHFHDSERALRLCKHCFLRHIDSLDNLPGLPAVKEPEVCFNSVFCYTFGTYTLLMEKTCSNCGLTPLPTHYHKIIENKRYCFSCTVKSLKTHG